MKRKIFSVLFALVLVLSFSLVTAMPAAAAIINVDSGMTTPAINTAIAGASGDTVQFAAGTYNLTAPLVVGVTDVILQGDTTTPGNVVINAGTIIIGVDRDCFQVMANNVTIQGFRMENATTGTSGQPGYLNGGIMVGNWGSAMWATNPNVANLSGFDFSHNSFDNCNFGIYFFACSDAVISHNTFTNFVPTLTPNTWDANAVRLWATGVAGQDLVNNVTISHNTISDPSGPSAASLAEAIHIGSENSSPGNTSTISNVTVEYNDISGARMGICLWSVRDVLNGVLAPTWTNINIKHNSTHGNWWANQVFGAYIDHATSDDFDLSGIHFNYNCIYGNGGWRGGFTVNGFVGSIEIIDAENNWWGYVTGPGAGSAVGSDGATVDYDPWLCSLVVDIDIKPCSDPNSINPNSKGLIPVAILGSTTFDVTTVDVTTLDFEGASPAHDLTDPLVYAGHLQDVNSDGFTDLVSHYRTQETGIQAGHTEATLTGTTDCGMPIVGTDSVKIVGRP